MYYKYPRTLHVPWSPGTTSDDKILTSLSPFEGKQMIGTIKMDGENTNLYRNHIHARSIDSKDHESRSWVKGLWGRIKHEIPEGWRICGENLYAKHSIEYDDLKSYFMVFSIWDENNRCLSWENTHLVCQALELELVPQYTKIFTFNEDVLKAATLLIEQETDKHEGLVFRNIESFQYDDFQDNVCKWVRKNHITTDEHWMFKKVEPNKLKGYEHEKTP